LTSGEGSPRRLQFELHGDMQQVMERVRSVQAFLLDAGCAAVAAQQMAVVAEEIFVNIVSDAWPGREPGHCSVDVEVISREDSLQVILRTEDDGIAFDPTQAEPPDLEASLDDRPIGGLGIMLVRSMTDTQVYRRTEGHNILEVGKVCPLA